MPRIMTYRICTAIQPKLVFLISNYITVNAHETPDKPRPCVFFYISGDCRFGPRCIYSHGYTLRPGELDKMRMEVDLCESTKKSGLKLGQFHFCQADVCFS
jgi:hypothetical protein